MLASSTWLIDSRADELSRYVARGGELMTLMLDRVDRAGSASSPGHLRALSPQRTLDRGYAIAQLPSGAALRSAKDAPKALRSSSPSPTAGSTTIAGDAEPAPSGTR